MVDSDAPVEQATAAPGEKRNVRRILHTTERHGLMVVVTFDDGSQEITFKQVPA